MAKGDLMQPTKVIVRRPVWPFAALCLLIASLVGLMYGAFVIDKGVRGYATGESLWSKGRKDAIHALELYLFGGDEKHWLDYQAGLAVPLADREARLSVSVKREGGQAVVRVLQRMKREGFTPDVVVAHPGADQDRRRTLEVRDMVGSQRRRDLGHYGAAGMANRRTDLYAALVRAHRTTLVFVNTRRLAERVAGAVPGRLSRHRPGTESRCRGTQHHAGYLAAGKTVHEEPPIFPKCAGLHQTTKCRATQSGKREQVSRSGGSGGADDGDVFRSAFRPPYLARPAQDLPGVGALTRERIALEFLGARVE